MDAVVVAGMIGALAPEILRLYQARLTTLVIPKHYWIVSVLYIALGGYLSHLLARPGSELSGFYIGASLPVIVGAAARARRTPEQSPDLEYGGGGGSMVEEIDVVDVERRPMAVQSFLALI